MAYLAQRFNGAKYSGRSMVRLHPREDSFEVSQGRTVLSTNIHGFIMADGSNGLFVHQTRMLSRYRWLLDGMEPLAVALSNVEQHSWLGYYIQAPHSLAEGAQDRGSGEMENVSERSVELRLSRTVGWGVHEDIDLTNYAERPVQLELILELDADFADQIETVRERQQFGQLTRRWQRNQNRNWELLFDYVAHHRYEHQGDSGDASIHRSLAVEVAESSSEPERADNTIRFHVQLEALDSWHACIRMHPLVEHEPAFPLYPCYAFSPTGNPLDVSRQNYLNVAAKFSSSLDQTLTPTVIGAVKQAKCDLASLRLHDLDQDTRGWVPAAGIPIYVALFGRDTLMTSHESAMLGPETMQGTLPVLAALQGTKVDDWRDEQPGRMLHEVHTGPLASLCYNPRARYYGSATTSGFYPMVLADLWRWTGDKKLIEPLIEPALAGLRWKDDWADVDGDGFYEYLTRSTQGVKNQGWKDSSDAIVYADGRQAEPPIATCEEQGFVYASKLRMAELLWELGRKDEARHLRDQAIELKKRFNESFWMEDERFVALGLDSKKRQIRSITSNPGHCLASGIVDESRVAQVGRRLMAEDMFSGWGVRTLSALHPAFNPYSYHRGTVWPVEHGLIALGLMYCKLHHEMLRLARGMFEAAELFDFCRLPEVFSGHQRDARHPFPALYPKTNWPQAWSAASVLRWFRAF